MKKILLKKTLIIFFINFLLGLFILLTPNAKAEDTVCCEIKSIPDNGQIDHSVVTKDVCTGYNSQTKKGTPVDASRCDNKTTDTGSSVGSSLPKFNNPLDNPKLAVKIPGLNNFRNIKCDIDPNDGKQYCYIPWLADYMSALYRYGTGIIAILAVVVMMIAGVIWITAAGNEQKVAEAKKWISGSLFGVLIALSSFMILNIVNPALTTLSPIKLTTTEKKDLYELSLDEQDLEIPVSGDNNETPTNKGDSHGVPWFLQVGPLGKSISYGCGNTTISSSGCGVVSTLMVLGKYGKTPSMQEFTTTCLDSGARTCGSGSNVSGLIKAAGKYGLTGVTISFGDIPKKLDEGVPVIISLGGPCTFTKGGHYIVLTGWRDKDKQIADVNDPANGRDKDERTWISLKSLGGCSPHSAFYLHQ